ncbi:MAG: thiolase family protein [Thermodesulfobacteriota bacterium]
MKDCVIVDGVRTANCRAHSEKGWFRNVLPDELLKTIYLALFNRNPQIKPEDIESVFCGTANQSGYTNDIARFGWLAAGLPEDIATNGIGQQCASGMAAVEHAARAIMCGEGDIYIASGVEDMQHVPMGSGREWLPLFLKLYKPEEIRMGMTAEKVAEIYQVNRKEMELHAYYSHKRAAEARDGGKFADEIIPLEGEREDGTKFMVDSDQWIRNGINLEEMSVMKPSFKNDGVVTAATSSPLTTGACALLLMSRNKADQLGCPYHLKYRGGVMVGCDPTIMGIGPIFAVRRLLERTKITVDDIDVVEINEAFSSQVLACVRELGIEMDIPFKKTNLWGGAIALGHPLGESGARIIVTLNSIMKKEKTKAKYGLATLCGGFGNASASLWEKC